MGSVGRRLTPVASLPQRGLCGRAAPILLLPRTQVWPFAPGQIAFHLDAIEYTVDDRKVSGCEGGRAARVTPALKAAADTLILVSAASSPEPAAPAAPVSRMGAQSRTSHGPLSPVTSTSVSSRTPFVSSASTRPPAQNIFSFKVPCGSPESVLASGRFQ